ncbi:hypothetical protein [Phenylobacterium sp.]|uniref:hypothetical protein n=1 Tax=Phenylobacterium sp. TaxID=1871053 RepID=UPI002731E93F|nr:hypothetical protein [Phenylobacterium sp.]MDP1986783.1 hypothetical protein [Phenylobacterium sp.]
MGQALNLPAHLIDGHLVTVSPINGGWCVASTFAGQPLGFFSGAEAEASARRLAITLAQCGEDAHVIIHDRRNVQVGTVHYFGAPSDDLEGAPAPI